MNIFQFVHNLTPESINDNQQYRHYER
jgi:hypothetical protein